MFRWFLDGDLDTLYSDVMNTLQQLAARNVQLGVLSNYAPTLERRLVQLGIRHYFGFVVVSSLVGLSKPDPAIFNMAVTHVSCPRSSVLYVGDNPEIDIEGAERAGLPAVLLDRENQHIGLRCLRVHSLFELPDLIDNGHAVV